ncbi:DUF6920 family protein [Planomicrobium okeanokoites]|uniref:DUF6920 family protein n=1 Tax=Planomicrobium okeanokoites TaxID=244 RepID=UPI0030F957EB
MKNDENFETGASHGLPHKTRAEMHEPLPVAVKNWLQSTGALDHEPIRSVRLKQTGTIKLKPEQRDWTASESEQISYTDPPAFRWDVKMKLGPGIYVTGKDSFEGGKGSMRIKLGGIMPISKTMENEKTDQSSLQRYLMELAWYPTAALGPYISWEEEDAHTAIATLKYAGLKGTATFYFDEQYELVKVEAWRYKESDEESRLVLCTGTIKEQQRVGGLKVPVEIEISWLLESGTFTWYRFRASDIRFNDR